jgi:hypothetical protein
MSIEVGEKILDSRGAGFLETEPVYTAIRNPAHGDALGGGPTESLEIRGDLVSYVLIAVRVCYP